MGVGVYVAVGRGVGVAEGVALGVSVGVAVGVGVGWVRCATSSGLRRVKEGNSAGAGTVYTTAGRMLRVVGVSVGVLRATAVSSVVLA